MGQRIDLHISIEQGKGTSVEGPIDNPALCDHLLCEARRVLEDRWRKKREEAGERRIVVPDLRVPGNGHATGPGGR